MFRLIALLVSVFTWAYPQPQHSQGLLVIYGGQRLIEANANWHGYDLSVYPNRCGMAVISPSMLGRIGFVMVDGYGWVGPCLGVDVVSRKDAYGSIYERGEIAEISWAMAEHFGVTNGGVAGYVWFGVCPPEPSARPPAEVYRPPLVWDTPPYEHTPSFFPYPEQQMPVDCSERTRPAHYVALE